MLPFPNREPAHPIYGNFKNPLQIGEKDFSVLNSL
jgi:hypothetical protein